MAELTFPCPFCGHDSGFGRRATGVADEGSRNPYAKAVRKYRCEHCARISDVERSGYDWTVVDRGARG